MLLPLTSNGNFVPFGAIGISGRAHAFLIPISYITFGFNPVRSATTRFACSSSIKM